MLLLRSEAKYNASLKETLFFAFICITSSLHVAGFFTITFFFFSLHLHLRPRSVFSIFMKLQTIANTNHYYFMLSSRRCENCTTRVKVIQCENCSIDICMKCTLLCYDCKKRYCIWCADDLCSQKERIKYVKINDQTIHITNEAPLLQPYQTTIYVYYSCCS